MIKLFIALSILASYSPIQGISVEPHQVYGANQSVLFVNNGVQTGVVQKSESLSDVKVGDMVLISVSKHDEYLSVAHHNELTKLNTFVAFNIKK